jgi:hypothetical protein
VIHPNLRLVLLAQSIAIVLWSSTELGQAYAKVTSDNLSNIGPMLAFQLHTN